VRIERAVGQDLVRLKDRGALSLVINRLPTLKEAEEALINEALASADGNQGIAAGILGVSRQALNKRLSRGKHGNHAAAAEEECPRPLGRLSVRCDIS
jgi:DNA-binding NtrC family response regulator